MIEGLQLMQNDSALAKEEINLKTLENDYKNFVLQFIDSCNDPVVTMFALGYSQNIEQEQLTPIVINSVSVSQTTQALLTLLVHIKKC